MSASTMFTLRYADDPAVAPTPASAGGTPMTTSYSLVELPAALLASVQSTSKEASSSVSSSVRSDLVIKGQPTDDAVLCTRDATYNLRAVKNSNSLLLCRPAVNDKGKGKASNLEIETTLHQTLELELVVPKLDRIAELLRGSEWSLEVAEEERVSKKRKRNGKRLSKEDLLDLVPASDGQVEEALRARRVLEVDGECRLLAHGTLVKLLRNILQTILLLSQTPLSFNLPDLAESLERDDGIPRSVIEQVATWFGQPTSGAETWELLLEQIAKEVGRELLESYGNKPVAQEAFMEEWRQAIGEQFSPHCDIGLLKGFYITNANKTASSVSGKGNMLTYFPISSLPLDPAARFSDLFSVKQRWSVDEIQPFLADLAVDQKKRDALTLKFTRKIKGEDGQNYYAARGR